MEDDDRVVEPPKHVVELPVAPVVPPPRLFPVAKAKHIEQQVFLRHQRSTRGPAERSQQTPAVPVFGRSLDPAIVLEDELRHLKPPDRPAVFALAVVVGHVAVQGHGLFRFPQFGLRLLVPVVLHLMQLHSPVMVNRLPQARGLRQFPPLFLPGDDKHRCWVTCGLTSLHGFPYCPDGMVPSYPPPRPATGPSPPALPLPYRRSRVDSESSLAFFSHRQISARSAPLWSAWI